MNRTMTVAEVAAKMRCSQSLVRGIINAGVLPAIKVGGATRVTESALRDYLASLSRKA